MLNNIVDNIEQCGQQNNIQSCRTAESKYFAVYPLPPCAAFDALLRLVYNVAFDRLFLVDVNEWSSCECYGEKSYTLNIPY